MVQACPTELMNQGLGELKFSIYFLGGCVASQESTQAGFPAGVQMCLGVSADPEGLPAEVYLRGHRGDFWESTHLR